MKYPGQDLHELALLAPVASKLLIDNACRFDIMPSV